MGSAGQTPGRRRHALPGSVWLIGLVLLLLLSPLPLRSAAAFQLFYVNDSDQFVEVSGPSGSCPSLPKSRPVLFVHGHPLSTTTTSTPSYQRNWVDGTSFKATLDLQENEDLDIEDYYIEFLVADRSILEDANKIGEAIALIQNCQDAVNPGAVKVAVIGYSKGTISTRLYLRSRHAASQGQDLSSVFPGDVALVPHSPMANPVTEFVALAAPNHGLRLLSSSLPIRQLGNGRRPGPLCTSYPEPLATDFLSRLNGVDANDDWSGAHETPASRANGAPVANGTLFVSIYDNDDVVGGDQPDQSDCATPKRKQAFNRGVNAQNLQIPVTGTDPITVHQNTVKEADVICQALYTVVHQQVPPAGSTNLCEITTAGLPIIPNGTGVVLLLDHSGSMGIPACPTCGPKQAILRDAVEVFLATWQTVAGPKDKVGITYFRTGLSQFVQTGSNDTLVPVLPDVDPVLVDLQMQAATSSGLTAMGGALQSGILGLQGVTGQLRGLGPNRHVILFTDGQQNVNPKIQDDANQQLVIDNAQGFVDAGLPVLLGDPVAAHGITVDTIGIGVTPASQALLADLSQETSGEARFSIDINVLNQFFTMTLMDTLRGSSPQLVAYRFGSMANDEESEVFAVNSGARQIVLRLSWQRGADLDFRVEKDGIDLTKLGSWTAGEIYKIFALDLPATATSGPVETGGDWRMVIRGRPGIAYEAAAIVDEPQLDYRVFLGSANGTVGMPLELRVELSAGGRPIDKAGVSARVARPSESIGNLLAAYPALAGPTDLRLEPAATVGQRAAAVALQDQAIWQKLQPSTASLTLEPVGGGVYRATFDETEIPGIYSAAFEIDLRDPQLGSLQRVQTVSTPLRVAAADSTTSRLTVVTLADTDRGREVEVRVTPRDRFGNHFGPDHGHLIALKTSENTKRGAVRDLGNGSYAVPLIVPPEGQPQVTLSIAGRELFSGPLSGLKPRRERPTLVLWALLTLGWLLVIVLLVRTRLVGRSP